MSEKQDRQGARTASDLVQRYSFGKTFAEVMGFATDAQETAKAASEAVNSLDQEELEGIYSGDDTETIIGSSSIGSLAFQGFLLFVIAIMLLL